MLVGDFFPVSMVTQRNCATKKNNKKTNKIVVQRLIHCNTIILWTLAVPFLISPSIFTVNSKKKHHKITTKDILPKIHPFRGLLFLHKSQNSDSMNFMIFVQLWHVLTYEGPLSAYHKDAKRFLYFICNKKKIAE